MRIVIADDMGPALRYLRRVCRQAGHDVVAEAWNGQQAVDFCEELKPDVAILDNSMPVMTGRQAAEIVLRDKTAAHVIIVTTLTQGVARKKLEEIGCLVIPKTDEDAFVLRALREIEGRRLA